MEAINPKTGAMILGTLQKLTGRCNVTFHRPTKANEEPKWQHDDYTEIFWNDSVTASTPARAAHRRR